jgi:hypothetical protein
MATGAILDQPPSHIVPDGNDRTGERPRPVHGTVGVLLSPLLRIIMFQTIKQRIEQACALNGTAGTGPASDKIMD